MAFLLFLFCFYFDWLSLSLCSSGYFFFTNFCAFFPLFSLTNYYWNLSITFSASSSPRQSKLYIFYSGWFSSIVLCLGFNEKQSTWYQFLPWKWSSSMHSPILNSYLSILLLHPRQVLRLEVAYSTFMYSDPSPK